MFVKIVENSFALRGLYILNMGERHILGILAAAGELKGAKSS